MVLGAWEAPRGAASPYSRFAHLKDPSLNELPKPEYRATSLIRKRPPPENSPRTSSIGLKYGRTGWRFPVSEVTLYVQLTPGPGGSQALQGYLAYKKTQPPHRATIFP